MDRDGMVVAAGTVFSLSVWRVVDCMSMFLVRRNNSECTKTSTEDDLDSGYMLSGECTEQ